jgi:ABC-type multidrug transport system fused ATPase/permease subunit
MLKFLYHFFFFQISPLVKLGKSKVLTFDDLLEVPEDVIIHRHENKTDLLLTSKKDFLKSVLKEQKYYLKRAYSFYLLGILASLSTPLFINRFIESLTLLEKNQSTLLSCLPVAIGIGLISIVMGIGYQHNFYAVLRANVRITARLNRLIFEKSLRLSQETRQKINVGDVVNHMSSDTEVISDVPMLLGDLGWATLLLIGSISMLFYFLGITGLVAIVIIVALTPVTQKIAKNFMHLEEEMMKYRDERVTLMGQILQAMRIVKYFVWEKEITNQVSIVREKEISSRKKLARAEMLSGISFVAISTLALFIALGVHLLRGQTLTPALVLTCVSLFGLLQEPVGHLPGVLSRLTNAWVSAGRLINYLSSPEVDPHAVRLNTSLDNKTAIELRDVLVSLKESAFELKNLNVSIAQGEHIALVGKVGSGKSLFLQTILGEFKSQSGDISCFTKHIGYVSQESYIMNATIKENLILGRVDINDQMIQEALRVTLLEYDVKKFEGGLLTEIGEKGVNLSGGQKQRLSLARCYLHQPELILLDDPLSAVDVHTEDGLVELLIKGKWQDKTLLMATHRLEHLRKFDKIIYLEEGEIKGFGSYEDLLQSSLSFTDFVSHHQTDQRGEEGNKVQLTKEQVSSKDDLMSAQINETKESKIMSDEDREMGAVKGSLYWSYIKALGGDTAYASLLIFLLILGAFVVSGFPLLNQWWLSYFTGKPDLMTPMKGVLIYGVLAFSSLAVQITNQIFWLDRGIKAGINLHNKMLSSLLKAPMRFFDTTPVGRLLQRFSRDLESVDIQLQWSFEAAVQSLFQIIVSLFLIVLNVPLILFLLVPLSFVYYQLQLLYRMSAREVKRLDSIHRSPRYAHFKETLGGLPIIRAFNKTDWFKSQFFDHLEKSQKAFVNNFMLNRWFSIRIPLIGGLISGTTGICLVYSVSIGAISSSMAGLVILYSLSFWGALNWGIRILSDLESRMTSIERIRFMTEIPSELPVQKFPEVSLPTQWPNEGSITFDQIVARYDDHLPDVVKGLSVHIPGGSHVGVIGRTGAGKSTLFQLLYRFINPQSGKILIDGIDIASIDLFSLRSKLAVIPQDPILFMGTLRSNLDPYSKKTDEEVWLVIKSIGLYSFVKQLPNQLLTMISDGGQNFSQGQRQLFCLGRALLLNAKIVMLDEATASVDVVSDALIQKVLSQELKGKTVLIIAHRLGTVSHLDYIMEMKDGKLLSFSK